MAQQLAIETRGSAKQFDRHIAVNDIDLQVAAGEVNINGIPITHLEVFNVRTTTKRANEF